MKEGAVYRPLSINFNLLDSIVINKKEKILYGFQSTAVDIKDHPVDLSLLKAMLTNLREFYNQNYKLQLIFCADNSRKTTHGCMFVYQQDADVSPLSRPKPLQGRLTDYVLGGKYHQLIDIEARQAVNHLLPPLVVRCQYYPNKKRYLINNPVKASRNSTTGVVMAKKARKIIHLNETYGKGPYIDHCELSTIKGLKTLLVEINFTAILNDVEEGRIQPLNEMIAKEDLMKMINQAKESQLKINYSQMSNINTLYKEINIFQDPTFITLITEEVSS